MSGSRLLRIRLSLKGRPIRTFKFDKDSITIGRNPESDIFLDNQGISRDHCRIQKTDDGNHIVIDECSANGTFINDEPVQRSNLQHEDLIRVGKFSMWVGYEEDKRGNAMTDRQASPQLFEGTTVLRHGELEEMMQAARSNELKEPATGPPSPVMGVTSRPKNMSTALVTTVAVVFFVIGSAIGASAVWYFIR